ncbi:MAG: amylo-alpha-1,6-glucosidase [Vicinamibacterales bacterium]|nr:amylo-alpha-1,6-glucosidase [Vicinamibacterales bacterium]
MSSAPSAVLPIRVDRDTCGDLARAETREWLVTNGIGGYASGTVAGVRTRRYHGLLVAALDPPAGRTVMAADVHERVQVDGASWALGAARWHDGTVAPRGYEHLDSFRLDGRTPVWDFAIGPHRLEKRIVMARDANTTVVVYRLVSGPTPVHLDLTVLAAYRDYHATTRHGGWQMAVTADDGEVRVTAFEGARALRLSGLGLTFAPAHVWYGDFALACERERGLDWLDDALHVATATAVIAPGAEVVLVLSAESGETDAVGVRRRVAAQEKAVLSAYARRHGRRRDPVGRRLALAADQFVVRRDVDGAPGTSVIAGYHWFADWGRDTMIALPGLLLETGRAETAREVLTTYARVVDRGMIPNRFPEAGTAPEYNTVDATLWFVEAVRLYVEATGDGALVQALWPTLEQIVDHHDRGTRFGIVVDAGDGLLRAGEPGVQLTWMDAKVDDWVVTHRIGKPVEVNVLWYSTLATLARLAPLAGANPVAWRARARQVRTSFRRFWREDLGHLCDVLDGPDGDDASLRPNQIFAVSLPLSPLAPGRRRAVVDACASALVTPRGLRSLAPSHADYRPTYGGDPRSRDGAYHQGTVWAWLAGPFALAHFRAYGDAAAARAFLEPLVEHLPEYGVGSLGEIFDAAPPHHPRGCIAQAWSVAETLRAWTRLGRGARGG